jgi:hypothetical protein
MTTKMKQRSFYMDDETYSLIERYANTLGASKGTALRMIVRAEFLGAPAEPVSQRPVSMLAEIGAREIEEDQQREGDGSHAIVLPPDKQETFKVPDRFKEKGPRTPKAVHSDDDF